MKEEAKRRSEDADPCRVGEKETREGTSVSGWLCAARRSRKGTASALAPEASWGTSRHKSRWLEPLAAFATPCFLDVSLTGVTNSPANVARRAAVVTAALAAVVAGWAAVIAPVVAAVAVVTVVTVIAVTVASTAAVAHLNVMRRHGRALGVAAVVAAVVDGRARRPGLPRDRGSGRRKVLRHGVSD